MSRTVAFATLGCRLNQVDTQQLQGLLEARGYRTAVNGEPADVVVVNTCTVTARAELSDRQAIRRAARGSPHARVVVTGCWAQTSPESVAALPGVDLVVGNADKHRLPDLVDGLVAGGQTPRVAVGDVTARRPLEAVPLAEAPGRSRAFLKVQDGCQHRCAFCIVPFARGPSRSLDPHAVVDQAQALVAAGHPEVVLTGIDLGHYGADLVPRTTLAALLARLAAVAGLRWVRLSSLLPAYFTDALLDVVTTSSVVTPHFHVPLQSGSDRILRRMRRPYTVGMFRAVVERLAGARPHVAVGTDVIAGFPGETETDFAQTLAVVRALPLSYLHVFPYSERRGTEAADLDGHVDPRTVTRRAARLREAGHAAGRAFREALRGRVEDTLVLEARTDAGLLGLTGNYVEVRFQGPDTLRRRLVRVRVTGVEDAMTYGELVQ